MIYAKKLIVLSGLGGKGTVTLERSAAGLECRLTTYNLPDLAVGNYVLAVFSDRTRVFELGSLGRLNVRVNLDADMRIDGIHFAVAESGDGVKIRLYGTNAPTALWEGNMVDSILRNRAPKKPMTVGLPEYSGRKIEDYFLDIFPSDGEYRDNAVANVNFYSPGFDPDRPVDSPSTGAVPTADEMQPTVAEPPADDQSIELPSEMERRYILGLAAMATATAAQSAAGKTDNRSGTQSAAAEPNNRSSVQSPEVEPSNRPAESDRRAALKKAAAARDIPKAGTAAATRIRAVSFYEQTAAQIERLFKENPRHAELEMLLPDTKWVRVDFDGKRYYAVGLVGAKPDYVGYAVPAVYTPEPPEELDGYAVWVPRNAAEATGEGFWVMYQDAITGESVRNTQT